MPPAITIKLSLADVRQLASGENTLSILFRALNEELDRYDPWSHEVFLIHKEIAHVVRESENA